MLILECEGRMGLSSIVLQSLLVWRAPWLLNRELTLVWVAQTLQAVVIKRTSTGSKAAFGKEVK